MYLQWLLDCFNCIYEKSELISKHYIENMSWPMYVKYEYILKIMILWILYTAW